MERGKFITFEGGEGAGKSTQVTLLKQRLEATGVTVICTREPGGFPEGDMIRSIFLEGESDRWHPASEALLMYAARKEHVIKVIEPALSNGTWVISDRFADSTMAYQGYARGLGQKFVAELHRLTLGSFEPDITFILDLTAEACLARVAMRGGGDDRMERQGKEFHEALRSAFLEIAKASPERCYVINGGASEQNVADDIWSRMTPAISEEGHVSN